MTFVAVLGATATVILSECSLQEARQATREAHTQAVEAKRQANIAERAFVENDRPMFEVEFMDVDILGEKHQASPYARILVHNIGSKPGFIQRVAASFDISTEKAPPKSLLKDDCKWNLGVKITEPEHSLFVDCSGSTLSFSESKMVAEGSKRMYITGIVEYKSSYGASWTEYFSFYWFIGAGAENPARIEVTPGEAFNFEVRTDKKNE